jgi:hypothetical protein
LRSLTELPPLTEIERVMDLGQAAIPEASPVREPEAEESGAEHAGSGQAPERRSAESAADGQLDLTEREPERPSTPDAQG